MQLMGDQEVRVREGAVKSLITVSQSYPRGIKIEAAKQSFWESVIRNCQIDDRLVVTIDYGLCKEVRDDGKNLRLESFNLLQSLAKRVHLETALF